MAMSEKIRIILLKRKMSISAVAKVLNTTQSNFSNKLTRDNFNENELVEIAKALNCKVNTTFTFNDTGEEI